METKGGKKRKKLTWVFLGIRIGCSGCRRRGCRSLSSLVWGRLDKKEKKQNRKKTHTFVVLGSVSGAVGEVAGAAMGDQSGGRGCGTPVEKEKKKGKKKTHHFLSLPYRVRCVLTWRAQPGRPWCI
jgi:hypothetical protein